MLPKCRAQMRQPIGPSKATLTFTVTVTDFTAAPSGTGERGLRRVVKAAGIAAEPIESFVDGSDRFIEMVESFVVVVEPLVMPRDGARDDFRRVAHLAHRLIADVRLVVLTAHLCGEPRENAFPEQDASEAARERSSQKHEDDEDVGQRVEVRRVVQCPIGVDLRLGQQVQSMDHRPVPDSAWQTKKAGRPPG